MFASTALRLGTISLIASAQIPLFDTRAFPRHIGLESSALLAREGCHVSFFFLLSSVRLKSLMILLRVLDNVDIPPD